MQRAVRLAAILLALTWIAPAAQAAAELHDFTLIDGTNKPQVQPELARLYTASQGVVFEGCYRGVAELNRPVADVADARRAVDQHNLRPIAHIFYLDNAKTLVSQRVNAFAHSVREQPVIASAADSRA
jgi:hypothetical protein